MCSEEVSRIRQLSRCCLFFCATFLLMSGSAYAGNGAVIVRSQSVAAHFEAYAQVEPIVILHIRAARAGIVTGINVVPGDLLKAGQTFGTLGGSEIQALLAQMKVGLTSAQDQLKSAKKALAFQQLQRKLKLTTRLAVYQAEIAVAQAQSALATTHAQLRDLQKKIILKAPADALVLTLNAGNGEFVTVGQPILSLQPTNSLWLKARYYGADAAAIHVGMSGQFSSAGGGESIPVKVSTVFGALTPDGGESVGLRASALAPAWLNGRFGTVRLNGPVRSLVAVPTRALILDQGKWWVLVHTASGNHAQLVTPGLTRGWQTFIEHGLEPGAAVVVENAYLEFHHGISQHYQPPD